MSVTLKVICNLDAEGKNIKHQFFVNVNAPGGSPNKVEAFVFEMKASVEAFPKASNVVKIGGKA